MKLRFYSTEKVDLKIRQTYLITKSCPKDKFSKFGSLKKIHLNNSDELYTASFVRDSNTGCALENFKLYFIVVENEETKVQYSCSVVLGGDNKGNINIKEMVHA